MLLPPEEIDAMSDDEALDIVFLDGFSTSPVPSEISGYGIGLAAVRNEVEDRGGSVDLDSRLGAGLTVTLRLPRGHWTPRIPEAAPPHEEVHPWHEY